MNDRYRLLLVDDDAYNLDTLYRVLREEYDLVQADGGQQALELLRSDPGPIDLVLSDKMMPGMNGLELMVEARHLRPDAARIIITGYPDASDLVGAINRGEVYRYIAKPFEITELRVAIAQALEHAQLARDNRELIDELRRKNVALRTVAARVADSYLHEVADPSARVGPRDLLASAALPGIQHSAEAIVRALVGALEEGEAAVSLVAREVLAEARKIAALAAEVGEVAEQSATKTGTGD